MVNEETHAPEMPESPETPGDGPDTVPADSRRWLAPDDEGVEEAGYGYGV